MAQQGFWSLRTTIVGACSVTGIRHRMYHEAETYGALCYPPQPAFRYDGADLLVKLFFGSHDLATGFQIRLRELNSGEELIFFQNRVLVETIEDCAAGISADFFYPVTEGQYDPCGSNSPTNTRNQIARTPPSVTSASEVLEGSPLFTHQSIEKRYALVSPRPEKAHIKNKACCTPFERTDPNNLLALSPSMHSCFDGGGFRDGSLIGARPTVIIQGCRTTAMWLMDTTEQIRHEVELSIKCEFLHTGSTLNVIEQPIGGVFKCAAWVTNTGTFTTYLKWKYENVTSPGQPAFFYS